MLLIHISLSRKKRLDPCVTCPNKVMIKMLKEGTKMTRLIILVAFFLQSGRNLQNMGN